MSGEYPFPSKVVSPAKCNEKPWDLWVSEIGHLSPRRDDDAFVAPAPADGKSGSRRVHDSHPYKPGGARPRRSGLHRLKCDSMSLHGLFPQMDDLNAAMCHLCGVIVKCSAAYRHLVEAHAGDALPPPPPPATHRNRSRHKKEPPPPAPPEPLPKEPALAARLAPDLYLEEAGPSEVQLCAPGADLPVVSIQDTEDLPLGETLTDDIFAIMNSEGIQSADDIANSADWKNIIRDIGNLQDINFSQPEPGGEAYAAPPAFLPEADLAALQLATEPAASPRPKPPPRAKTAKSKFNLREYDPNKHCGVVTGENPRPCTRSLTCKAHALSLRRLVEGRAKPFDALLAEHRAARDAGAAPAPLALPPLLVAAPLDIALNGLPDTRDDVYASILGTDDPPVETKPITVEARAPRTDEPPPALVAADVCWYSACPRPLALCTFNASHAGGAVSLGKRYATVRSNIKSSLSRSQCKAPGATNNFYYGQNALSLSKSVHMNASKTNKPEVRKLIVTCGAGTAAASVQSLSELFAEAPRANGHVSRRTPHKHKPLDLPFPLDPLLADEKC